MNIVAEDLNPYAVADVTEPAPLKPMSPLLPLRRKWWVARRLLTCFSMTAFFWFGLNVLVESALALAGFPDLTFGTLGDYFRWALVVPAMLFARHRVRVLDSAGAA